MIRNAVKLKYVLILVGGMAAVAGCDSAGKSPASSNSHQSESAGTRDGSVDLTKLSGAIAVNGSSTLEPVSEAVAEEFQKATANHVKVKVGTAGTGGGFKKFNRGEIDICDASRPILKAEMDDAREQKIEYIELPVCFDALTIAVHPSSPLNSITVDQLKRMWEPGAKDKVTRWNHVEADWPDAELRLFGAGLDSGTFDYFTEAIVGKAKACRDDYTPNEDDNALVQGIAGDKFALGFIPFAYYEPNKDKLKALAIDAGNGPVLPSTENVLKGTYNPLARPLFLYVNRKSAGRPEVKAFVEFYLKNAHELVTEIKYLPLPPTAYAAGLERFAKLEAGTAFGGEQVIGLPIDEILKRRPQQ